MQSILNDIQSVIDGTQPPGDLAPYNHTSRVAESSCVVKAGAGYLFGLTVSNANVAARFIQWFDSLTLPADATVPLGTIAVAAASDRALQWVLPRAFRTGIVLCASTTQNTKTLAGADHVFDVQYV